MSSGLIIILAVAVIFVIIPICFRLVLKLFEPGIDGDRPVRNSVLSRRKGENGEWGRDDAGMLASTRSNRLLPHQRRSRPGRMR